MSHKNLDHNGRWRNLTIAFRVSPEENEDIKMRVRLSGLTKQEYICRRLMERDIVVMGNPRVYKALKGQMEHILEELHRIEPGSVPNPELMEAIRIVAATFDGMRGTGRKESN